MAKSKRTSIQRRPPSAQQEDPRQAGLRAFHANRFDEAIRLWSQATSRDDALRAALAEAHFRRGLNSGPTDQGLEDMLRAVKQLPDESRYRIHLGRFLQLRGDRAGAIVEYRAALERDPGSAVAARLLAYAELEQNAQADIHKLPAAGVALVAPAQALLQGKQPPASDDTPLGRFWRGLGRLAAGDAGAADDLNDSRPLNASLTALRRYYQGVVAAGQGNYEPALKLWQQLEASGHRVTRLRDNLSVVQYHRLRTLYDAGDPAAAALAQQTATLPGGGAFDELRLLALDRGAQVAATTGDWQRAIALWEAARIVLGNASSMGSPRPLLHNLALAYEKIEHWETAADAWRAMLRTRPRRKAAAKSAAEGAAPQATAANEFSDQHWAWVRERIISCYKNAGRPDEGVVVFRQMLKEDPDDLDLRVQLVDALLANEQERAAANEVERILKIDAHHVGGSLRKIALLDSRQELPEAEQVMRDLLARNPEREDLRQIAARLFLQHGARYAEWGRVTTAYQAFVEGEQYEPENYLFVLNQARMLAGLRRKDEIPALVERAIGLAGGDTTALEKIFETWVIADDVDQAQALITRFKDEGKLNPDAYAAFGLAILLRVTPPPTTGLFAFMGVAPKPAQPADTPWTRLAVELMDTAVALQPDNLSLHSMLASELMLPRADLALRYAEAAVRIAPDDPEPLLLLGMAQGLNDQLREAKASFKRVGVLARRNGNSDLGQEAQELGRALGTPAFRATVQMSILGQNPFGLGDLDLDDIEDFLG